MPNRESYRKKAVACLEAAEGIRDAVHRAAMLQVAKGYMKLAEYIGARHERGSAHHFTEADPRIQNDS
jgi:hypothetical protein